MKKILLIFGLGVLFVGTSCSTYNSTSSHEKKEEKLNLKGNWIITDISYSSDYIIKPFDEMVDISCFKGSTWKLVTNNNSGTYTVSNSDCVGFTTNIKFNVTKDGIFSFKKIPVGTNAKDVKSGYFLQIRSYDSESFELVQNLGANISPVVYYFHRAD